MFPFTNFSSGLTAANSRVSRWKGNLAVLWTLPYYGSILLRLFFLCLKDLTSGANQLPEIDKKIATMDLFLKHMNYERIKITES